jgi:hypothetical protein
VTTRHSLLHFLTLACFSALALWPGACSQPTQPQNTPAGPDTTSHDFIWEEITLGDDHSHLKDVFAISDSDVWAVGKITTRDSANGLVNHNAVHWDGHQWNIVDILIPLLGTNRSFPDPLTCVFAFSPTDVWFSGGGDVEHWNGKKFTSDMRINPLLAGGITRMWGNNGKMWFVGTNGSLVYYAPDQYRKVESGTPYDINDVWGTGDTALCVASNWLFENSESHILRLVNGKAEHAYESGIKRSEKCIWFAPGMRKLMVMGGFSMEWNGKEWWRFAVPSIWYKMSLRGNSPSDIFAADQYGGILHYNGVSWIKYEGVCSQNYNFMGLACTKNQVWAVGDDDIGHLIIVHGRRR